MKKIVFWDSVLFLIYSFLHNNLLFASLELKSYIIVYKRVFVAITNLKHQVQPARKIHLYSYEYCYLQQ